MKAYRLLIIACTLLLPALLPACAAQTNPPAGAYSPEDVAALVLDWEHAQHPALAEDFSLQVKELPIPGGEALPDVQVFQVADGIYQYESFLLQNGDLYPMGAAFGGMGVNSLLTTDLDGDGAAELIFTYSFGSGIHRSQIGLYAPDDAGGEMLDSGYAYLGDLTVQPGDESAAEVWTADPGQQPMLLGTLRLETGPEGRRFWLEPAAGLSLPVEQNLVTIE